MKKDSLSAVYPMVCGLDKRQIICARHYRVAMNDDNLFVDLFVL